MKKLVLSLGFICIGISVFGQTSPPSVQWIKSNNGQQSEAEYPVKSVKDANGFYYVLANTSDDAVVAKFDNSGAAVNNYRYNEYSNNNNFGYDLKVDASGNIYICGEAFVTSQWNWKPTIVKLSPAGNLIWEQVISCGYYTNSQARAIALDNNGNVFFAGANSDSLSVGLISTSGALLWEKKVCPAGYQQGEAYDVVVDGSNAAYVTGKVKNTTSGNYDFITFKINSSGTVLWTKLLSGAANADDAGSNIEIDASGNSYVTGTIADSSSTNYSALLVKYNASGGQQWVKKLHMSGQVEAVPADLVLDPAGNAFIAINHYTSTSAGYARISKYSSAGTLAFATTYNDASYNKTEAGGLRTDAVGNIFVGGTKTSGCCSYDIFCAKFNAAGIFSWNNNFNSVGFDKGVSIHLDNGNNAIVTGNGSASGTSPDIAVVKYSSAGTFQWDGYYNGAGNPDDKNIKVFNQGNYSVYSLGYVNNVTSNTDVLLSKYDNQGNILWQNVLDYNSSANTPRDMDRDNNFNISILADNSSSSSLVASFDSIGSPIFTTYFTPGYNHTCMKQDNSGNIYTAGAPGSSNVDFCVAKVDATGAILVQTVPATVSSFRAVPVDIDIDNNGRFYVFGSKVYDLNGPSPYKKMRLQRFSATGSVLWSVEVSGLDSTGTYYQIDSDWQPKKILVESNNSYVLMNARPQGNSNDAAIVVKYDANGAEVWRWVMNNGDTWGEAPVDIDFGANNSIYVLTNHASTGKLYRLDRSSGSVMQQQSLTHSMYNLTFTAMNYGALSGNVFAVARGFGGGYNGDVVLVKADSACNQIWETAVGGDYLGDDWPTDVSMTANGRIYVSGGVIMNNGTSGDAAVIKFCDIAENTLTASGSTQNLCPGSTVTLSAGGSAAYQWNVAGETDTTLAVSASGIYYCTTYKADGCWKNTDTLTVTVKNPPSAPEICQVTVDTASIHNIIYWDKTTITDADSVRIYREDVTNVYTYIGSVSLDSAGEFHDTVADPNVTTKRYKISAIDSCGNESALSLYHNTIYIVYNGLGQFSWNPLYTIEGSPNPVNNYVLMRMDSTNGTWAQIASTAGTQNTIVDPAYSNYPAGQWRVETVWNISCDPNRAMINTSRSNIKAQLAGPVTTGLNEQSQFTVGVYPNPFNETTQFSIRTSAGKVNAVFELFDETGRMVKDMNVTSAQFTMEKGNLANGIYFYVVRDKDSGKVHNGKIVVKE